ncbi:unnamed protein product [Adineta steineri]|uniref:Uncharacterized protein n=1 Tax=Adineta steineri TaxID=433720 RepID=A0A819HBX2_9BILA|nr:unnamed protein product [Adineta steineri]CAF3897459.1 unnamed protein product [Adineta steineri]
MTTAAQDIDYFIERQRSKINKQNNRRKAPQVQAQTPPPVEPLPLNHLSDQSIVQDMQFSQEQSPRLQSQQSNYLSSSPPFPNSSRMDQHQGQQFSNDNTTKSYFSFFDRFGTHDEVRSRLNDDLKREYNEYLQSLQNMTKKRTSEMIAPSQIGGMSQGSTTRRVQFSRDPITGRGSNEQHTSRSFHNSHSMNDISSNRGLRHSQSMNNGTSSGRTLHNIHSMNDMSSTSAEELAASRARARLVQQESEKYIRDREEYILELYEQIYELEGRIRQLENESRKLTITNSTNATRARYTEDLNALNALLAERLNQRVAIDYELAEILNRPPVPLTSRSVIVTGVPSSIPIPIAQATPRPPDTLQLGQQTARSTEQTITQTKMPPEPQPFKSPRTNPIQGRPSTPQFARGSLYNHIFGNYKTEEQVMKQERYRQDLLKQIEEKRLRDAEELARRRAAEERERAKQLAYQRELERQAAEEALRKQEREEAERRAQQLLAEEAERKRREEELERQRKEEEEERRRRLEELARQRQEDEAERLKRKAEAERLRQIEEAERQKRREEAERLRRLEDLERLKRKEDEEERRKRLLEEERQRRREEEEEERRRREELERRRREEDEEEQRRREEEERRRREEEEERRRRESEEERRRREEEERRRREEEERRRNTKVVRTKSPISREVSESEVLRRLEQLKRQLKEKEDRLRDAINEEPTTTTTPRRRPQVDFSSGPYLPPPQPFYLLRRESSDDLLEVARIHYRDAPLTHDILLNILKTTDGDEFNPSYVRDDSVMMRGIAEGKRITSAEFLTLPKRPGVADDLFGINIESIAGRRRYQNSLPGYYDGDYPLDMMDKELNRITHKNDHRLSKLRHIELDDGAGFDMEDLMERFEDKQRSERRGGRQGTVYDTAWLK